MVEGEAAPQPAREIHLKRVKLLSRAAIPRNKCHRLVSPRLFSGKKEGKKNGTTRKRGWITGKGQKGKASILPPFLGFLPPEYRSLSDKLTLSLYHNRLTLFTKGIQVIVNSMRETNAKITFRFIILRYINFIVCIILIFRLLYINYILYINFILYIILYKI